MYVGLHVKYPLFLSDFNENFLDRFSKNTPISVFMKIRLVGVEVFRADGHRDMARLMIAFRSFANAPKNLPINSKFG